jgi:glycosyltransferase involved in cell wall biosynthesis
VNVAVVHDYLTQRGGAERVVLSISKSFPDAPIYTSVYEPESTFPEFRMLDVRPLALNALPLLRRHHRLGLPLYAPAFSRLRVSADAVLCSSSGWAHGASVEGRKVVYCHTPARWLYQPDLYDGAGSRAGTAALAPLRSQLTRWDVRKAASADRYLANSSAVRERIRLAYGVDAEILPPPPALDPSGVAERVDGLQGGFVLCVARLLPYKNVDAVIDAFRALPELRLAVVGTGPQEEHLRRAAPDNVRLLGSVGDPQLRWLYARCSALVAAAHEDLGMTPLEAAAFGKPAAVLRWGGFRDTVRDGETGVFFDRPQAGEIAAAVAAVHSRAWDADAIRAHAAAFSEDRFAARLREIVREVVSR